MTEEEFKILLNADKETEHLEFKEANKSYAFNSSKYSICGYCVALANERGGKLILGVGDKGRPRIIVGTCAFRSISELEKDIFNFWKRRVIVEELFYGNKRVLILNIPSRPIAEPLEFKGQYLMRVGDRLESMTPDVIKKINNEAIQDYSAEIVNNATWDDLSTKAIKELRLLLGQSKRVRRNINDLNDEQLLRDLQLLQNNKFTRAALLLLGKESALKKFLPYAETCFSYKIDENEIRSQDTAKYCKGYLLFYEEIWEKIDSRNFNLHIPERMLVVNKKVFDDETIREAIHNAITHRDYSITETIFIFQTQFKLTVKSPGGFLEGINPDNIMDECRTRNKLIADILDKCELVEHLGNGADLMIKNQLSLGKNSPDWAKSDKRHVILEIDGTIKDIEFARYVLRVARDKQKKLNYKELIILDKIKNNKKIKADDITENLLGLGLIEKLGYGKYMLSKSYYQKVGRSGEYTRRKGLDKKTNKILILEHLKQFRHKKGYMSNFLDVLKDVPRPTINRYLQELKKEKKIKLTGNPRISRGPNRAFYKITQRGLKSLK